MSGRQVEPCAIPVKRLVRRWKNDGAAPWLRDDVAIYELPDGRWLYGWVRWGVICADEDEALERAADYREANPGTGWVELEVQTDGPQLSRPLVV